MLDKNEFRAIIARHGENQGDVALAIGMSPVTLSAKLNGNQEFKRCEIELMALRYNMTAEDVRRIFFTEVSA